MHPTRLETYADFFGQFTSEIQRFAQKGSRFSRRSIILALWRKEVDPLAMDAIT